MIEAKKFPPIPPFGVWSNLVALVSFALSPQLKKYVRDLEGFRDQHRFD